MPMFPRFLRPIPSSRRAYSFFSSKSGGGRYFNSAKPPKVVAHATTKGSRVDAEAASQKSSEDAPASASQPSTPSLTQTQKPIDTAPTPTPPPAQTSPFIVPPVHAAPVPTYPPLSAHDLNLHQFFSLHRPLFLHSPSSTLFDSYPAFTLGTNTDEAATAELGTIDDPPEASPEADAEAARQLARALVINRVGSLISWDETMRRLGVQVEQMDLSGHEILMDSTKRKRRKKMKKHKLKKRRKLQRAQRVKIGR
ncbi:hypothetical protein EW146_g4162 [Bondarzewia mesenterica]|uniref:Small ribosomal subunit protein mS38 n=1 Tax=Bondarzewia mesenterica TaxID=1095465 RepID=A0A4S4LVX0_9AGAM|nr:hypothetical protein EW146_g4162 [Bondarzewia mesenterica]